MCKLIRNLFLYTRVYTYNEPFKFKRKLFSAIYHDRFKIKGSNFRNVEGENNTCLIIGPELCESKFKFLSRRTIVILNGKTLIFF